MKHIVTVTPMAEVLCMGNIKLHRVNLDGLPLWHFADLDTAIGFSDRLRYVLEKVEEGKDAKDLR